MCKIPRGFSAEQFTFTASHILQVANFKEIFKESWFPHYLCRWNVIHV